MPNPDEINVTSANNPQAGEFDPATGELVAGGASEPQERIVKIDRVWSQGDLISQPEADQWATGKARGAYQPLGNVRGIIEQIVRGDPTAIDLKQKRKENLKLAGRFYINDYRRPNVTIEAEEIYLPRHYLDLIDSVFDAETKRMEIDCVLGIEATGPGANIKYAWAVHRFDRSGRNEKLKREMEDRRKAIMSAGILTASPLTLPGTRTTPLIEAQPKREDKAGGK